MLSIYTFLTNAEGVQDTQPHKEFSKKIPYQKSILRTLILFFWKKPGIDEVCIVDDQTGEIIARVLPSGDWYFSPAVLI